MIVHFKIELFRIQNTKEALAFCQLLADEMVQSDANRGIDIKTIQYTVPKTRGNA